MSGETIKEFLVGLGFDIDEKGLQSFQSGITKATLAVGAIGAAATAAAGLITRFVSGVAEQYDTIGDLADRVNTTAEEVMRLGYVATLTGSDVNAANSSLENLSRTAGEAALGIGRGAKIFEDLGLSAKDQNGELKDTSVLMAEIGARIKDMGRGEQLAVLNKLGIDSTMVNALTKDVSALTAEFDQLYKNAGIDANKAAEQAGEFNDSMERLKMTFGAIKSAVGLKFMNQIRMGVDALRKFLTENMPKIINAVSPIISLVLRIAEAFISVATRVGSVIGVIIGWLAKVNNATNGWAGYILAAVAAWKYLNLAFLASPIGIIIALVAAIALLIDDFLTWKEGGDSLINWEKWSNEIQLVMDILGALKGVVENVFSAIFGAVDAVVSLITGDFSRAFRAAKDMAGSIGRIFGFGKDKPAATGLKPSPQAASSLTGGGQTVSQSTQIVVQASNNPEATARSVAGQQNRVNADMTRNMKGAAR